MTATDVEPTGRLRPTTDVAGRFVRRIPVSLGFALLLLVTAAVAGTFLAPASPETQALWAAGVSTTIAAGAWWTPLTALFVPWDPFQLAAGVLAGVFLLGIAERLLGAARTVLAFAVTGVVGITAGVILQWAGSLVGEWWASGTAIDLTLDPLTGIVGALMTASAFATALWRRRLRVVTFAFLLVFVLYDGDSSNTYRLLAAVAGVLLGGLLSRERSTLSLRRSSHRETRTLLATVVAVTAIGPVVALVNPEVLTPFALASVVFDSGIPDTDTVIAACEAGDAVVCERDLALASAQGIGPFLLAFVPLALLLLAAWGLRAGRRFALWLAIVVNLVIALLSAFAYDFSTMIADTSDGEWTGFDIGELVVWALAAVALPLGIALVLWLNRRHFAIVSPHEASVRFVAIVGTGFALLAGAYFTLGLLVLGDYVPEATVGDLVIDTVKRFLPVHLVASLDPHVVPSHDAAFVAYQLVGPLFWALFLICATLLMSASETRAALSDHRRIRELLHRDSGTLGFMATWPGNVYWFSDDGQAAVAYRVIGGVAITTADPICAPARAAEAVRGFADFCDRNNWTPVFYSVHPPLVPVFEEMGWQHMSVGEETLVRTTGLELTGKPWQKVRQALNRGIKEGLTTVWTSWDELPLATVAEINAISEQWVSEKSLPEMGFTLGGMEELKDPEVRLMLAVGPDGRVQAVTSWLPAYRDGVPVGWTIDFMRRADGSMNGVMEFLIASAALHMKEEGAEVLSLSGAPLATKPLAPGEEPPEPTTMSRLLEFLARTLEPAYGFSSLFRFKAKFNPEYETLSMAYPDPLALPAIGVAVGRAYLPEVSPKEAVALVRTLAG